MLPGVILCDMNLTPFKQEGFVLRVDRADVPTLKPKKSEAQRTHPYMQHHTTCRNNRVCNITTHTTPNYTLTTHFFSTYLPRQPYGQVYLWGICRLRSQTRTCVLHSSPLDPSSMSVSCEMPTPAWVSSLSLSHPSSVFIGRCARL